ncbi:unnamed protein product [Strongylus vulgaris]|uniref:Uncharacterized protein n=1 Tax=Strongylus vulgaris TaxID=40348 RepID=A0A3P7IIB9_STRVU|nr:unnamed protein product [Strongylus vulgaris]
MSIPTTSLYSSTIPLCTVTPSVTNFSVPTTSVASTSKAALNPPHLPQLSEQALMALLKERVQLGDVRLTLLNLYSNEETPNYHFLPTMIEIAEKAIAALDNKDMIVYAMYKEFFSETKDFITAALDAGCAQLGTIMQASNPTDPANQIASLASAMGINPTPFASLMQVMLAGSLVFLLLE